MMVFELHGDREVLEHVSDPDTLTCVKSRLLIQCPHTVPAHSLKIRWAQVGKGKDSEAKANMMLEPKLGVLAFNLYACFQEENLTQVRWVRTKETRGPGAASSVTHTDMTAPSRYST